MTQIDLGANSKVAVLVDCDNTSPEILEYALRVFARSGAWCCAAAMATTAHWPTGSKRRWSG